MSYLFIPPVIEEGPMGGNGLFSRYTRLKGVTVFKVDDSFYETMYPVQDDLLLADVIYMGGHEYNVSEEEKNDLESAGYEVEVL